MQRERTRVFLGAAPFVGRDIPRRLGVAVGWGLVGAAAVGTRCDRRHVARGWWWTWSCTLWSCRSPRSAARAFAALLALTDGTDGLRYGAEHETEYLRQLADAPRPQRVRAHVRRRDRSLLGARARAPARLRARCSRCSTRIGLGGVWPMVVLSVRGAACYPLRCCTAVRRSPGAEWVRRCAPLLIVAPYALWMVTSGDAVFTAVGACGVAACVLGAKATSWRRAAAWGVLGRPAARLRCCSSPMAAPRSCWCHRADGAGVATSTAHDRRGVAASAVRWPLAVVTAAFAVAGFWWFDGAAGDPRAVLGRHGAVPTVGLLRGRPTWPSRDGHRRPGHGRRTRRLWHLRRTAPPISVLVVGGLLHCSSSHLSQYTG